MYPSVCGFFHLLHIMFSGSSILSIASIKILFLFIDKLCCIDPLHFICSSVDGHLGCFHCGLL